MKRKLSFHSFSSFPRDWGRKNLPGGRWRAAWHSGGSISRKCWTTSSPRGKGAEYLEAGDEEEESSNDILVEGVTHENQEEDKSEEHPEEDEKEDEEEDEE